MVHFNFVMFQNEPAPKVLKLDDASPKKETIQKPPKVSKLYDMFKIKEPTSSLKKQPEKEVVSSPKNETTSSPEKESSSPKIETYPSPKKEPTSSLKLDETSCKEETVKETSIAANNAGEYNSVQTDKHYNCLSFSKERHYNCLSFKRETL